MVPISNQIIKLAHDRPELRKYLVPLLRRKNIRQAGFLDRFKKKKPEDSQWMQFLKEKYPTGKAPNPNLKTRMQLPDVQLNTALKDKVFLDRIHREYEAWKLKSADKPAQKEPVQPNPAPAVGGASHANGNANGNHQPEFLPTGDQKSWKDWGSKFDYSDLKEPHKESLNKYTSFLHSLINSDLRSSHISKETSSTIKDLDAAFQTKAASLPTAIKVRRAIDGDHPLIKLLEADQLKLGQVFEDKGFMSTSINSQFDWADYHLNIAANQGAKALYLGPSSNTQSALSDHPSEYEVLLPRNQKIKVLNFDKNTKTIECELA